MQKNWLLALGIAFVIFVLSALPSFAQSLMDDAAYRAKMEQLNSVVKNPDIARFCPGAGLALSCGNGKCERASEDEDNCPADCVPALVSSYDHAISCEEAKRLYVPADVAEVQTLVRDAIKKGLHVRVIGRAHSHNTQICTDGIVISTEKLNQVVGQSKDKLGRSFVWVEAGMTLNNFTNWLNDHKLSIGFGMIGFRDVTVGGAVATGAHGSSAKYTSVVSNLVSGVRVVLANGDYVEFNEDTANKDILKAFRTNLGMLGVVTEVQFKVMPQFNLHVKTTYWDDSALLRDNGLIDQMKNCDFGEMLWFPNSEHFMRICGLKTKESADNHARNILLRPPLAEGIQIPYRVAVHYGHCYEPINAALEWLRYLSLEILPPFQKKEFWGEKIFTTDLVGQSQRMQSSGLTAAADSPFFMDDWEFAVPMRYAQDALRAFSQYANENGIYLPMVGVFLRLGLSEDKSLLAHTTPAGFFPANEPVLFIEFPTPQPVGFSPQTRAEIDAKFDGLANMLITQFHARPHWGKNNAAVIRQVVEEGAYGDHFDRFKAVRNQLDPNGVFSNEFARTVGF